MENVAQWLDSIGSRAFSLSATLFVLMNGAAVAVIAVRRDRQFVNRWTSRILAANLLLVGTGVGIPIAALLARSAVMAMAPITRGLSHPAAPADNAPASTGISRDGAR
jgi:hypothetical protein